MVSTSCCIFWPLQPESVANDQLVWRAVRLASMRLSGILIVLQSSPTENPWLSAISSHFSYWTSSDTALFVLRAVYGLDVLTGASKPNAVHS